MRLRNSNCAMWIWNSRLVTTDREPWQKKPRQVSRSMGVRKTHRACAAFSTNAKSPQEFSRYEHRSCPSRCTRSSRLHQSGSSLSLHRSDAFGLLHGSSIPRASPMPIGATAQHILEQASNPRDTLGPSAFQRAGRSITFSRAGSIARSTARTFAIDAQHEIEFIQRRIGMLDFVLLNQGHQYLETEPEKVRFFCEQLKVPKSLPALEDLSRPEDSQPTRSATSSISSQCSLGSRFFDRGDVYLSSKGGRAPHGICAPSRRLPSALSAAF